MKIRTLEVAGIGPAVHALRNPYQNYHLSDTVHGRIGRKDMNLSDRLSKAGGSHSKHMRLIQVWAEVWAPLYWWKQMDCYRMGVEKLSTSTMHSIMNKPFQISDFEVSKMPGYKVEVPQFTPEIDPATEQWVQYEGYSVSNQGRIKNSKGLLLNGVLHDDGYRCVYFKQRVVPLHRVVAMCFCPGYEDGMVVDHIDGNKQNNRADNLEWVTQKENIRRSRETHLQPNSAKTYAGKLTEEERNAVIEMANSGKYSRRELASLFNVSHTTICSIINHRYKYAGGQPNLFEQYVKPLIVELNRLRDDYIASDNPDEKQEIWDALIQILPESYIQRRTVMMSYQAIRHMYEDRAGHRLVEWQQFRDWCETLPESWMITGKLPSADDTGKLPEVKEDEDE